MDERERDPAEPADDPATPTEDPRRGDSGADSGGGYPEDQPDGQGTHPAGTGTSGADDDAPEDGDAQQATGNPDAAG
jgi:hypothetical protein